MNKILVFALGLAMVLAANCVALELVDIEFGFNGIGTSSLLNDSTETWQNYSMNTANVSFYPTPMTKVDLKGEFTYYTGLIDLGNYMLGGGLVLLPTKEGDPIAVHLSGNFETRHYRSSFLTFNSTDTWNAVASVGRQFTPTAHLRAGFQYSGSIYTNSEVDNKNTYEFFAGLNKGLGGSVTLDLEAGYSTGNYVYVDSGAYLADTTKPPSRRIEPDSGYYDDSVVTDGTVNSVYISPRLSFKVGPRTGLTLGYSHRSYIDENDKACIYGQSSTLPSQWNTDYAGDALTVSLKTFLVPHSILSVGLGYFKKDFLSNSLERIQLGPLHPPPGVTVPDGVRDRQDEQTRLFISAQLPLASRSGPFVEPSVQVEFTNNTSSINIYDYHDVTITAGLKIKL